MENWKLVAAGSLQRSSERGCSESNSHPPLWMATRSRNETSLAAIAIPRRKPKACRAPIFLEGANQLKISPAPAHADVFEDAVVGVETGHAGGFLLVVGIGQGDHAADLRAHGADIVVDLRELSLEQQWAQP